MKYFTKDWCFSNLNDEEIENSLINYDKYINTIYNRLPVTLKLITKNINLHDGRIKKFILYKDQKILILEGVFGDLEVGYFSLEFKYRNACVSDMDNLMSIFNNQRVEILRDELEILSNNYYSHKMIFSMKKEIDVIFEDVSIHLENKKPVDYDINFCEFIDN